MAIRNDKTYAAMMVAPVLLVGGMLLAGLDYSLQRGAAMEGGLDSYALSDWTGALGDRVMAQVRALASPLTDPGPIGALPAAPAAWSVRPYDPADGAHFGVQAATAQDLAVALGGFVPVEATEARTYLSASGATMIVMVGQLPEAELPSVTDLIPFVRSMTMSADLFPVSHGIEGYLPLLPEGPEGGMRVFEGLVGAGFALRILTDAPDAEVRLVLAGADLAGLAARQSDAALAAWDAAAEVTVPPIADSGSSLMERPAADSPTLIGGDNCRIEGGVRRCTVGD
jgi:hypothetical protein